MKRCISSCSAPFNELQLRHGLQQLQQLTLLDLGACFQISSVLADSYKGFHCGRVDSYIFARGHHTGRCLNWGNTSKRSIPSSYRIRWLDKGVVQGMSFHRRKACLFPQLPLGLESISASIGCTAESKMLGSAIPMPPTHQNDNRE